MFQRDEKQKKKDWGKKRQPCGSSSIEYKTATVFTKQTVNVMMLGFYSSFFKGIQLIIKYITCEQAEKNKEINHAMDFILIFEHAVKNRLDG